MTGEELGESNEGPMGGGETRGERKKGGKGGRKLRESKNRERPPQIRLEGTHLKGS